MEALHLCEECALKRRHIETKREIDPLDCQVFERIITMLSNTDQSVQIPAPEGLNSDERKKYFKNVIDSNTNAHALVDEWWSMVRRKYNIPSHARFDVGIPEFYECVDDNGVVNTVDDFVPKTQNK
jgi:hypothetical protein